MPVEGDVDVLNALVSSRTFTTRDLVPEYYPREKWTGLTADVDGRGELRPYRMDNRLSSDLLLERGDRYSVREPAGGGAPLHRYDVRIPVLALHHRGAPLLRHLLPPSL